MTTEVQAFSDTISLDWTIKDFDTLYEKCFDKPLNNEFANRKFIAGSGRFCFHREENQYVGLYLRLSCARPSGHGTKIQVAYTVAIESVKGELIPIRSMEQRDLANYKSGGNGWNKFISITELREKYLKEGVLTVHFTVRLYCGTTEALIRNMPTNEDIELRKEGEIINKDLAQGFGELLLSGQFSDMTFVFSSEEEKDIELKGHKMLLSVRSPVFSAMFNTNMTEGISGKVIIEDISARTFKMMLEFIYTGILNEEWGSVADDLIYAANKYELPALKDRLEGKIMDVITVNNAIKVRKMAKLCNLQKAEKAIEKYVKYNLAECLDNIEY